MVISIPEDVMRSVKLPPGEVEEEILKELAVALYARGALSLGKARKLAGLSLWQFQEILARYRVTRHYDLSDLEEDMEYARSHS